MKRLLALLTPFLVSIGIFMNVWQSFTYQQLEKKAQNLEQDQIKLIEDNRQGIMYLTFLKAREGQISIEDIVQKNSLIYPNQSDVITVINRKSE